MAASEGPNPALVFQLINAFQQTTALRAAVELELFSALEAKPLTAEELARRCGATERGIRILCDYLTLVGLISKQGGGYQHTPTSAAFLDRRSPACIASTIRFMNNPEMMKPYDQLHQIVRLGHTVLPGQGTVEPENPIWVDFAHNMAPMMAPMAGPLGKVVLDGRRGPMRVLDIAAGHGLFGIEIAKQNPEAEVVAVDWAPVLEVARANATAAGVERRYTLNPGSAFDVDFDGRYDAILLTNFLHHFDPPTNQRLLEKCHAALLPGGLVAALEFVPNPDRVSPPFAASFALTMLATTVSGDAFTFDEYEQMFLAAGLSEIGIREVPNSPHHIVTGRRRD
jgi:2-polyprenyl-3-methyl-5-hydroxy-6-metoxy-1,4-benzoquinol methylase